MFFFPSTKKKSHEKSKKKHEKTHRFKNTYKTNEISTFPSFKSVPMTTPDDQNHPKGPPGPPPDTLRKLHVFSDPPRGPPRDPPGPPGDPPRDPPGPPGDPPRDPPRPSRDAQGPPRHPLRPPGTHLATSKDLPRTPQDPPRTCMVQHAPHTAPPPPSRGNALKDTQANVNNLPEYLLKRFLYGPPVGSPSPPRDP